MGFFGRQLLKVIDWEDSSEDTIVYKYPIDPKAEIMMGSKLTVRESQVAIFVNKGKIADIFPPGYYKLSTNNLPVLTALNSWKYGFESPFKAEVYFINTRQFINQRWGTKNPIMMRDNDFGMVRLRGYGKFSFRVDNPEVFLHEIFGTVSRYKTRELSDYLSSILITGISDQIAESGISAIDLAASMLEFGESILETMQDKFKKIGLELSEFVIENVSLPEEVEKTMDKRTSMGVMGDKMGTYMQYESAQAMRDAAKNPGSGNFAGAGMGFGMGSAFGNMMTGAMGAAKDEHFMNCPACGAKCKDSAKFCPECGSTLAAKVCPKCGASVKGGAKFCPECGEDLKDKVCPGCGKKVSGGTKFCPECGEKL